MAVRFAEQNIWPQVARSSRVPLLSFNEDEGADDPGIRLLLSIRDIFVSEGKRQLPTILILRRLAALEEEEEWTTKWPRELASSNARGPAAKMATLLRPFGISAGTIRLPDGSTPKGYRLEDFADAFERYLPDHLQKKDATTPHDLTDNNTPDSGSPSENMEETPPA